MCVGFSSHVLFWPTTTALRRSVPHPPEAGECACDRLLLKPRGVGRMRPKVGAELPEECQYFREEL